MANALGEFFLTIGKGFNSFYMNLLLALIVMVVVLGLTYWWFINYIQYQYLFVEVGKNMNFVTKKGKIVKNKYGLKKFCVKGYDDPSHWLNIKEHNGLINGKNARYITWDGMGNLTYVDGFIMEREKYLKTALTPIERAEAVDSVMESAEKANFLSTAMKWGIGISVILIAFSSITLMMTAKWQFENQDSYSKTAELNLQSAELATKSIQVIEANTIAQNNMLGTLNSLLGQNSSIILDTK